jgi:hypothetical protein
MTSADVTTPQAEQAGEATKTSRREEADSTNDIGGGQAEGDALDDLIDYLEACCDDSALGYLHVGVGYEPYINDNGKYAHKRFEPKPFRWPDEAVKAVVFILGEAQNADVWLCPNPMRHDWVVEEGKKKTGRRKGDTASLLTVHADIDGQLAIEMVKSIEGAFAVASGSPGHAHVYVPLCESITSAQHDLLSRALGAYLGNADAKYSDNDLLRPPGTLNHKSAAAGGEPTPVVWLMKPTGSQVHPRVLADVLNVDLDAADAAEATTKAKTMTTAKTHAQAITSTRAKAEKFDLTAHPEVEAALRKDSGDRSADTFGVVSACFGAGLTLEQARWAVSQSDRLAERLDERDDDDVLVCWLKAVNSRQAKPVKRSVATQLVEIGRATYTLGVSEDGTPFGVRPETPHVALPLRGSGTGLRAELAQRYFTEHMVAPASQALTDAGNVLEGFARQEDPHRLHLRVARHADHVYIDLADASDRVIAIGDGTWMITDTAPVVFKRTELTAPMPAPERGGDLNRLWDFINVVEPDRPLVLAFMVAALIQPDVPHTILAFLAEHGSAKSTTTKRVVSLTDPSVVPLRMPPRDIDTWITGANGSWVVALDNLSHIPDWLSDALCRAATGDGNIKRQLYTDVGLSVIRILRCVILNGIDIGGLNGDLADRLTLAELNRITEADRRDETELEAEWLQAYPAIFSGLLDLAAQVHAELPGVRVDCLPRMADYAKVLACVDKINNTEGLQRYRERATHLVADSISSDPFIAAMQERNYTCTNATAGSILNGVRPALCAPPPDWPKKARDVTTRLTRHAPALRALGWHIENDGGHNKAKTTQWTVTPPEAVGGAAEGSAGHGKPPVPQKNTLPTCTDGSAGQAG